MPQKLGSGKITKFCFWASVVIVDWYLFFLMVPLNPDFNCLGSIVLSWVDKANFETKSFVSTIAKVVSIFISKITQFVDHVEIRLN